jgi:hypothetical protein
VPSATWRRGGEHSGARLVAMGGGEHGFRGRFAQWREGSRRWQGVFRATEDMVSHFLGDRVLDLHGHGEAVAARAC